MHTSKLVAWTMTLSVLGLGASCAKDDGGDGWGPGGRDTGKETQETGDPCDSNDSACDTSKTHTGESGETGEADAFDEPGDVLSIDATDEYVTLTDASGDSNQDQQFYVVLVNTGEDDKGFRLNYAVDMGSEGPTPKKKPKIDKNPRPIKRNWIQNSPPPPSLDSSDIGSESDEFFVSDDVEDTSSYKVVDATLWGLGEYVAIWVDNDVAIDWDYECDGIIDQPHQFDAYGFDNCDLQTVADIVDNNIIVNFRTLFAEESDINGDGRLSVVITPVLNSIPLTSEDEDDHYKVLGSYADPSVDLEDFDYQNNPGSDEQEVIYVFAPDPYGFYNPYKTTTVDTYTSQELVGQIATSYMQLITYNQHVIVNEGEMESPWLSIAMGTVGTDIVGFGAVFYQDAWKYLDAPHLYELAPVQEEGEEACTFFCGTSLGAQYLFGRWLVDKYGDGILADLATSENVGVDNVEEATGVDFAELVVEWQVAMLTTGVMNESGDSLMDLSTWAPYRAASTITAPTEAPATPTAGVYYGANGHQTGFNVRGVNRFMEGGTTENAEENLQRRVRTAGTDAQIYTPGFSYFGYISGYYGATVARLAKLPYESSIVEIQGGDGNLQGVAIRWNDSQFDDLVEENIFSALDSNAMALPDLPEDGSEVHALGDISEPGATLVISSDGETSSAEIQDLDRWSLDLSNRADGDLIQVAIWLDRRYKNADGDPGPFDPWIAIAEEDMVPAAQVGVTASDPTCSDGETWSFPNSLLESVNNQVNLSTTAYSDDDQDFDACGEVSETPLTCAEDWDGDGVADEDEPDPGSFVQQVMIQQCTNNNGTMPQGENAWYSSNYVDLDQQDEDEQSSFSAVYNVGGQTAEDGEEALLYAVLNGGQKYVIVVSGGDGDMGAYELHLRQLN